ncbi:uncharacterized protein G2W53_013958 [Senna tora]|uniref:Uncharacterized protein n=1 Tax=Senna tora TaxID=362788 RepID=A0A834U2W4_9FABA|nr:uncharacterized protein G2W53_013958 [Senna tora]
MGSVGRFPAFNLRIGVEESGYLRSYYEHQV